MVVQKQNQDGKTLIRRLYDLGSRLEVSAERAAARLIRALKNR